MREFVRIEIFPGREMPPPTSRQYFPTKKDIYSHMYRAMVKSRFSNCNQTNAEEKVKEWQTQNPNDKFFFRKYSDICDAKFENDVVSNSSNGEDLNDEDIRVTSPLSYQKFLFVHQTTWQRRLLSKYGNDICLLDATYKTTRYALPLFFLAVKTNVDYQVPPNSVFSIYHVLFMCFTLKGNRYITLILTLFFFFAFDTLSHISNKGNFLTSKFEVI